MPTLSVNFFEGHSKSFSTQQNSLPIEGYKSPPSFLLLFKYYFELKYGEDISNY